MKTLTLIMCLLGITTATFAKDVTEEVRQLFSKSYPGAQSVAWEDTKDGYSVFFIKKDVSYRIAYDLDGNVTLALKYYGEENLPPLILNRVKKNYSKYKVHSVVEESSNQALAYHIILENDKKIVNLKSDTIGTLEVESVYKKS